MERKVGDTFEYFGVMFRVEKETHACSGCYFHKNPNESCTYVVCRSILGECQSSSRTGRGVIFKKVEDMETRSIKLTLKKAKELYEKGGELKDLALSAFTEEELTKVELPETWEEFCRQFTKIRGEYYIDTDSSIYGDGDGYRDPLYDKNMLPSKKAAEAHLALMQLHQLRDCYRQGWKPDWSDGENKYCIVYSGRCSDTNSNYFITAYTCNRTFLSFQTKEIAKLFLENFRGLIEAAGDLV